MKTTLYYDFEDFGGFSISTNLWVGHLKKKFLVITDFEVELNLGRYRKGT
jgi:hypothetical protein